jgi:basic amino acid/polyamine antiporter, APA family
MSAGAGSIFIRKATGLVRSWSVFDAFIYAFFSINLITLGLYIFSQMYWFQGGLVPALVISAVFILFEVIVYAALIAVMPRSGGDYVWQSRILGGGIGFVLAVTGWWFILWLWVPLYGDMLRQTVITPLLGVLGAQSAALWFAQTAEGNFTSSIITLAIVTGYIMLGMKRYARIQKICFYGGMVALVIVIGMLLAGTPEAFRAGLETNATALYGAKPGVYEATAQLGTDAGAVLPLTGGSLKLILLTLPYLVFFNLWPNWGATLYGEVRGATDFKRNLSGMAWALGITTVLAIGLLLAVSKTIGWEFYNQANGAWWNFSWGYTDQAPALPVWPYPAMLATFLTHNRVLQFIILALMSLWWFGWSGTVFLSSTRVIFAAAFDRLLPEKVAEVDERSGTPVTALLLMVIPAILVSALWAWNWHNFRSLTLASTLVIAVTFLGTTIGAILLPYRKPDLYNASPIAKYKIFGIPLITLAGVIFGGFLVFLLYQWILDPNALYGIGYSINAAGLKNWTSIVFMLVLYVLAAGIYMGFKAYRRRAGIDITRAHQEIPVE